MQISRDIKEKIKTLVTQGYITTEQAYEMLLSDNVNELLAKIEQKKKLSGVEFWPYVSEQIWTDEDQIHSPSQILVFKFLILNQGIFIKTNIDWHKAGSRTYKINRAIESLCESGLLETITMGRFQAVFFSPSFVEKVQAHGRGRSQQTA